MNANERQALREKHVSDFCGCGDDHPPFRCLGCYVAYPCDVIKVLDATENLKPNDLKTKVECDHAIALHGTDPVGINFSYCPKCGEKLC